MTGNLSECHPRREGQIPAMCYNLYTLQLKMITKFLTSLPDALKGRLFPTIATKKVNGKLMFAFHKPGGVWRLFDSFSSLQKFLRDDEKTWCFEAETEEELEKYEPHDFRAGCGMRLACLEQATRGRRRPARSQEPCRPAFPEGRSQNHHPPVGPRGLIRDLNIINQPQCSPKKTTISIQPKSPPAKPNRNSICFSSPLWMEKTRPGKSSSNLPVTFQSTV